MTTSQELLQEKLILLRELERRKSLAINKYKPDDTPNRNQLAFHSSTARTRLALGGNQSGKSVCAAYEIAACALGNHKWLNWPEGPKEIYAISAEYRTLHRGLWRHLRPDGPDHGGIGFLPKERIKRIGPLVTGPIQIPAFVEVYYGKRRENGEWPVSTISFISGEGGENARRKVQAAEIDLVAIDEEIDEAMLTELRMRLLKRDGRMIISATLIRSDPWILELEDRFEAGDKNIFIVRLNSEENNYLSAAAREELLGSLTEEDRAVRVHGQSRRQFGLVYAKFDPDVNLYDPMTEYGGPLPPADWPRYCALDPGFRVFAGLWIAKGPQHFYAYREMYKKNCDLFEVSEAIAGLEGYELVPVQGNYHTLKPVREDAEKPVMRLIDPAAARHLESGDPSILTQLASYYGIACSPAFNSVDAGIQAVRQLLAKDKLLGRSKLLISKDLENWLKERRTYSLSKDKSRHDMHARKDEPIRRNNHLMDCTKYLACFLMNIHSHQSTTAKRPAVTFEERVREIQEFGGTKWSHPYLGSEF